MREHYDEGIMMGLGGAASGATRRAAAGGRASRYIFRDPRDEVPRGKKKSEARERAQRIWKEEFSQDPLGALAIRLGYTETTYPDDSGRHFFKDRGDDEPE